MIESKKFVDELKNLFKGAYCDGEAIWRFLDSQESEQNVAYFCWQIFDHVVASDKKPIVKENLQKFLATLLVLEFYKNKKAKKKGVLDDIRKLIEKPDIIGNNKWILKYFIHILKDDEFIQSIISRWTLCPSIIDWSTDPGHQIIDLLDSMPIKDSFSAKNDKYFSDLKDISFPHRIFQPKSLAFSYICFQDEIRNHDNIISQKTYDYLRNVYKAHIHAQRFSSSTKPYLMTTIHLLQSFITFYGWPYEQILKDLMFWSNNLRNCPDFIGEIAHQTFTMLHSELKSPGKNFRKRLRMDFPSLDMKESTTLNKQIYLVTSQDDFFSRPEHCSLMTLRKLIIMHILKISGLSNDEINEFHSIVEFLDNQMTYKLYYKMMKITDVASALEVYDKIKKVQKQSITELIKITKQQFQSGKQEAEPQEIEDFSELYKNRNPLNIFEYPSFQIIHVSLKEFINSKVEYSFIEIANKNKNEYPKLNFYQNKIPIIYFGDGRQFLKVLKVLANYLENIHIEKARQIKIYYLPSPDSYYRNNIAVYLASKDIWYKRFVYDPFRQKMLYPHIDIQSRNKSLFPSYLYNKILHMYLRQARRTMNVRIYKCHYSYASNHRDEEFTYVCSNILLGTSNDAQILKMNKEKDKLKQQKYSHMGYIEILTEKLKKITPLLLNMKIEYYNSVTKTTQSKIEKNIKVQDIQILNLPREYFMGNKPDPLSPYLEMTILLQNYGKIFRRQVVNKENFKKMKESETVQAFKDLFISMTICSIEIEKVKEPFNMIIDQQVFHELDRIRIEPAISENGLPVTIPIQCFLPFE